MRDRARDCDVSASLGAFWLTGLGDALGMSRAFSGVANADVGACVRVCACDELVCVTCRRGARLARYESATSARQMFSSSVLAMETQTSSGPMVHVHSSGRTAS